MLELLMKSDTIIHKTFHDDNLYRLLNLND
jgi:hypothetical protein